MAEGFSIPEHEIAAMKQSAERIGGEEAVRREAEKRLEPPTPEDIARMAERIRAMRDTVPTTDRNGNPVPEDIQEAYQRVANDRFEYQVADLEEAAAGGTFDMQFRAYPRWRKEDFKALLEQLGAPSEAGDGERRAERSIAKQVEQSLQAFVDGSREPVLSAPQIAEAMVEDPKLNNYVLKYLAPDGRAAAINSALADVARKKISQELQSLQRSA